MGVQCGGASVGSRICSRVLGGGCPQVSQIVPRNIPTKTWLFGGPGGTKCTPIRSLKQELSYRKIVGFGRYEMSVLVDTSVSCVLFCIKSGNSYLPKRGFSFHIYK